MRGICRPSHSRPNFPTGNGSSCFFTHFVISFSRDNFFIQLYECGRHMHSFSTESVNPVHTEKICTLVAAIPKAIIANPRSNFNPEHWVMNLQARKHWIVIKFDCVKCPPQSSKKYNRVFPNLLRYTVPRLASFSSSLVSIFPSAFASRFQVRISHDATRKSKS